MRGLCGVAGCVRSTDALGRCSMHYQRERYHEIALEPITPRCATEGCEKKPYDDLPVCFGHWLDGVKQTPGWLAAHPDGLWPWEREGLTPTEWSKKRRVAAAERSAA